MFCCIGELLRRSLKDKRALCEDSLVLVKFPFDELLSSNTRRCLALCVLKIFFTLLWISSPFAGGGQPELNLQEEKKHKKKKYLQVEKI